MFTKNTRQCSNECKHDSLYISKVKPVNKIHAQSCQRNTSKVKFQSSNIINNVPERLQRCSGV